MAVTALTKFTQGALVGLPGVALAGVALTQVDVENDDPTDVASWKVDLVYVPPGSVLVAGVLATGDSPSPFASFTPDVPGCYRVVLTVWDSAGMVGTSNVDIRNFGVPDSNGIIYPPYQELPRKLPVLGSGDVGEKPDELNFNQQPYGWDGDGTDGLMLFFMRQVSAAMSALASETVGIYSLIDNGQTVVIPDDQVMVNIGGLSIGSTPGDGGILDGPGTFVHVDQDRHFAKAKLHPREGLQILSTEMMLTRGTPDLSGTIYGGGMWGPSEMSPQELLAALGEVVPPGHFLVGGNSPMVSAGQVQTRDNLDVYSKGEIDASVGFFDGLTLAVEVGDFIAQVGRLHGVTAGTPAVITLPHGVPHHSVLGILLNDDDVTIQAAAGSSVAVNLTIFPELTPAPLGYNLNQATYYAIYDAPSMTWALTGESTVQTLHKAGASKYFGTDDSGDVGAHDLPTGLVYSAGQTGGGTNTIVIGEIQRYQGTFGGTLNMPATPSDGDRVGVANTTPSDIAVTLSGNGNNIRLADGVSGDVASIQLASHYMQMTFRYSNGQSVWYPETGYAVAKNIPYRPANGVHWADPDPTTIQEAVDRIAKQVYTLHALAPIPV